MSIKEEFLNIIQSVLDKIESATYERVDQDILWVGATDQELNRTIDLSFDNSLRIQIGSTMNYFESDEAIEEKVFKDFLFILYSEIEEIHYCKGDRVLKTDYQIITSFEVKKIGSNSYLHSIWKKKDNQQVIKHPPVINEEQYKHLIKELEKLNSNKKFKN